MAADGEEAPNTTPPPLPLPSYPEMILEAIDALDGENGSNKMAISGYIKSKYGPSLPPAHVSLLTAHLSHMKTIGELVFARNSYFRPDDEDEAPAEPAPAFPPHPRLSPEPEDPVAEDTNGAPSAASVVAANADIVPAPTPVAADADGFPAPAPIIAAHTTDVPVKRGRGRPPKPKDPVAETTNGAPAEAPVVAADAVAVPTKRGRGRPPKPKDPVAGATSGATAAPVVTADGSAVPVKRGRGRPLKPKDPVAEAVAMATSGMPRGRGHPPKKAKVAQEAPIRVPAPASGGDADANAVPVKRGRGRPPKVRSPVVCEPGNA
ncbi:HMG-Y-related protein A-like [Phragmites australis]|uniref:HMG-Y-related protein A-like n=1 Tax=Phragmites australis TaxID=29695 RepID=UPI002D7786F2|nr:HMG-Y-related protein A-like [Phragmites australis]